MKRLFIVAIITITFFTTCNKAEKECNEISDRIEELYHYIETNKQAYQAGLISAGQLSLRNKNAYSEISELGDRADELDCD